MSHQFIKSFVVLPKIRESLIDLRDAMESLEAQASDQLHAVHRDRRASARNLLHYLALRRKDLRGLQSHLSNLGLSSLEAAESATLPALNSVIDAVDRILGSRSHGMVRESPFDQSFGARMLEKQTRELLGEPRDGRCVRIMVTAPPDTAWDYQRMHDLVAHGMDCLRIDCALDDQSAWLAMIRNLQKARRALGLDCLLLMDLAGSKPRVGRIENTPPVLKVKPQRDLYGRVTQPARVWITAAGSPTDPPDSATDCLRVDATWLTSLQQGDAVRFLDTRGRRRRLEVIDCLPGGVLAELKRTAYLTNGTRLCRPGSRKHATHKTDVVGIEAGRGRIRVCAGDELVVTIASAPGVPAIANSAGKIVRAARVPCTLPEALNQVKERDRIIIDDGLLTGVVMSASSEGIRVRIEHAPPRGADVTAAMRLHFPDSTLHSPALTASDAEIVKFAAAHAELVGLSIRDEFDVQSLLEHVAACPGRQPGLVIRIETRSAFERLPAIVMSAMRHPRFGILVSRGDLALECGHPRLAGIQEEIVRLCQAAHCATLWSTQTFEGMIRTGLRTRAEMTDAALNQPGPCIVLGPGPHVDEALGLLVQSLRRLKPDPSPYDTPAQPGSHALESGGFRSTRRRGGQAVVGKTAPLGAQPIGDP